MQQVRNETMPFEIVLLTRHHRPQLFLTYSRCFVLLVLYCPFLHHIAQPSERRKPNAYACGLKCVDAAVLAVLTVETLGAHGMLYEAHALTVDILTMAATALLVVELGDPEGSLRVRVHNTSNIARVLLGGLAQTNSAAYQCLESLLVRLSYYDRLAELSADSMFIAALSTDWPACDTSNAHAGGLECSGRADLPRFLL